MEEKRIYYVGIDHGNHLMKTSNHVFENGVERQAGEDSLYPRNFISTLSVSKEYFGPQQIFGLEGGDYDYDGLDIVRIIDEDDLQAIKEIHEEGSPYVPLALQDIVLRNM